MMSPLSRITALLFVLSLSVLLPLTANAHKLRIFAWPEGDNIYGETAYSGNGKPKNVEITVQDAESHAILLTIRTDEQGKFSFKLPEKAVREQIDLLLVVNSGDGHRGEWTLPAAEYLALPSQPLIDKNQKPEPTVTALSPSADPIQTISTHIDEQLLRRIVAEEFEKKLAPLKYMLAESSDNSPDLKDILGGIGYILGLAGLLAWLRTKNSKKISDD